MTGHRIDKEVIELHCSSEERVGVLRQELSHFILPGWERVIGEILDEVSPGMSWRRIDRLEVDLGEMTMEEWKDVAGVVKRFEYRVRERMREMGVWQGASDGVSREVAARESGSGNVPGREISGVPGGKQSRSAGSRRAGGKRVAGRLAGVEGSLSGEGSSDGGASSGDGTRGEGQVAGGEGQLVNREGSAPAGEGRLVGGEGRVEAGEGRMAGGERRLAAGEGRVAGDGGLLAGGEGVASHIEMEWEMVQTFLISGRLPWWIGKGELPEMDILMRRVAEKMPERVRDWMAERATVAAWQRAGEFAPATRKVLEKLLGEVGLPDAEVVMRKLGGLCAARVSSEKRFDVIRGIAGRREAGLLRWLLREPVRVLRGRQGEEVREVLGELEEVRKRLGDRKIMLALVLLYMPAEVMESAMADELWVGEVETVRGQEEMVGGEGETVRGDVMVAAGSVSMMTGGVLPEKGVLPEGGEKENVQSIRDKGKGVVTSGVVAGEGASESTGGVRGAATGEQGSGIRATIKERGQPEAEERGRLEAKEQGRWFPLKASERRILEEIVKKRAVVTVGGEKLLAKLAKKIPLEDLVALRRAVDLPEEKLQELLSTGTLVTTKMITDERQRILVENAGLCLFAPYLASFFSRLGYMEQDQLRDRRAAGRAVRLLQYVATGRREAPEYLLSLNKILCGLLPEEVIPLPARLSKKEMAEADRLVEAVIANWSTLKSTSAKGLRGSFVCREGIITDGGARWVLRVERKEYDLLLKGLPWGYSYIKLPWMIKHLEVEW
ncbi:MAG TPA: contractile injection system tape measure protein [Puia sp.]|nr:contractile injection system tape measure protein [Puia sp.]